MRVGSAVHPVTARSGTAPVTLMPQTMLDSTGETPLTPHPAATDAAQDRCE
jgi:hypothetical protein